MDHPLGSLQVTCTASDPDGDKLSYEWTISGGNISGTEHAVIWTAPEEVGVYDITVAVDDGHDGRDTGFLTLIASNGPPPIIEDLIVTAKEPKYLKTTTTGYKVGKTKEYYIECIASDTGTEVSYEWSCIGGSISGEGSVIIWTAPNHLQVAVTVMVIVSDARDNNVNESIVLYVPSCSCVF